MRFSNHISFIKSLIRDGRKRRLYVPHVLKNHVHTSDAEQSDFCDAGPSRGVRTSSVRSAPLLHVCTAGGTCPRLSGITDHVVGIVAIPAFFPLTGSPMRGLNLENLASTCCKQQKARNPNLSETWRFCQPQSYERLFKAFRKGAL
jgi:hypothetical protein